MGFSSEIGSLQQTSSATSTAEVRPAEHVGTGDVVGKYGGVSIANVVHADQANLSSVGGLIAQALEGSDTRAAKVTALQEAITSGSYSVPSSEVAGKIVQSLLD
jgi:negative regulator of flagellin synthesis FlgM